MPTLPFLWTATATVRLARTYVRRLAGTPIQLCAVPFTPSMRQRSGEPEMRFPSDRREDTCALRNRRVHESSSNNSTATY
jgi:hypothetical protein